MCWDNLQLLCFKEIVMVCILLVCMVLLFVLAFKSFNAHGCEKAGTVEGHKCEDNYCAKLIYKDFQYAVFILFFGIVFICTLSFSENANVVNYISFAATLSSMILSILAIILTLLDSSKMDANKTKIDNIVTDLKKITKDYNIAKDNLDISFSRMEKLINDMDQNMNRKFTEMDDKLRKIHPQDEWKDWDGDSDVFK